MEMKEERSLCLAISFQASILFIWTSRTQRSLLVAQSCQKQFCRMGTRKLDAYWFGWTFMVLLICNKELEKNGAFGREWRELSLKKEKERDVEVLISIPNGVDQDRRAFCVIWGRRAFPESNMSVFAQGCVEEGLSVWWILRTGTECIWVLSESQNNSWQHLMVQVCMSMRCFYFSCSSPSWAGKIDPRFKCHDRQALEKVRK